MTGPMRSPARPAPDRGSGPRVGAGAPADAPALALVDRRSLRAARLRRSVVGLVVVVLVLALFAVGVVQAQLVQRQHQLDELRSDITEARAHKLRLAQDVVVASSPEEVVRRAHELGMVRAEDPVYLVAVRPVEQG